MPEETEVEVKCAFTSRWVRGFQVAERSVQCGAVVYRIRRQSDASVLPRWFPEHEVAPARSR